MVLRKCKTLLKYCMFFTFILTLAASSEIKIYAKNAGVKSILLINSYQKGLPWTDDETDGIINGLKNSGHELSIAVEYMDWKNYPNNENLKLLNSYFKYKYSKKQIDLVITTDDAALNFALDKRNELFGNAPVVFCGVNNNGVRKLTSGVKDVTGIVEEVDVEGTIRAALKINPDLKEVYVISDNTESGISTWELTRNSVHNVLPDAEVIQLNQSNGSDILDKVERADKDSIVIITTYYSESADVTAGFDGICEMVSRSSPVPVYHLYDYGLGHGALGGSMLSGKTQGENAAKLAKRILDGENIADIPVYTNNTARFMFDYIQMDRFNIRADKLPENSIIINKPFSFFEVYKNLVITVLIIIVLLIIFICVLLIYLKKMNSIKQELFISNNELSVLYQDLSASDEELKKRYNELTEVQKNLAASEKRYEQLFDTMMNGFFVFEPVLDTGGKLVDLRFLTVNPGFEKQTNKKITDLAGRTWTEVFSYKSRDLIIYQQILNSGESRQFETYYPDSNIYYLVNAFKINENQLGVVFDNITNYKLAIREVRKLNEELEQRVNARTGELQEAVNQLEAFTYTVSHDLKSPIRAVCGYSRIILEDYGGELNNDASDMLSNIKNISNEMIEMINKLLEYSTTSRSNLHVEEVNTETVFNSVFDEIMAANPERKALLKIETGLPVIAADGILFRQVVRNILSNAFKFTRNRETAIIRVGNTLTENEYIFYVRDNGVGFDMKYSSKLFGIFQRLHTSDEFEGSGIGLVTIKKIIEKHGGRTWIEGKTGVGAVVYFTIPFPDKLIEMNSDIEGA